MAAPSITRSRSGSSASAQSQKRVRFLDEVSVLEVPSNEGDAGPQPKNELQTQAALAYIQQSRRDHRHPEDVSQREMASSNAPKKAAKSHHPDVVKDVTPYSSSHRSPPTVVHVNNSIGNSSRDSYYGRDVVDQRATPAAMLSSLPQTRSLRGDADISPQRRTTYTIQNKPYTTECGSARPRTLSLPLRPESRTNPTIPVYYRSPVQFPLSRQSQNVDERAYPPNNYQQRMFYAQLEPNGRIRHWMAAGDDTNLSRPGPRSQTRAEYYRPCHRSSI